MYFFTIKHKRKLKADINQLNFVGHTKDRHDTCITCWHVGLYDQYLDRALTLPHVSIIR